MFSDENSDLKIYKKYSQANCFFECGFFQTQEQLKVQFNLVIAQQYCKLLFITNLCKQMMFTKERRMFSLVLSHLWIQQFYLRPLDGPGIFAILQ